MINFWLPCAKGITVMAYAIALGLCSASMLTGCITIQRSASGPNYGVPATDRTVAQRILDQSIENTARLNINALDETLPKRSRIGIDSFYSHLLLTGEVPDVETKNNIINIVSSMPDVKKVHDGLNVAPSKGVSYTVHDGYITSKLNAKILASKTIQTSQLKVVTDDGIVYILGKLTPTQRGHLMNIIESTEGIKKLVLLTELIDENGAVIDESSVSQEAGLEAPQFGPMSDEQVESLPFSTTAMAAPQSVTEPVDVNMNSPVIVSPVTAPVSQPSQNSQPIPSEQTPLPPVQSAPAQSAPANSNSAYIDMYKDQVPGWE